MLACLSGGKEAESHRERRVADTSDQANWFVRKLVQAMKTLRVVTLLSSSDSSVVKDP